MVYPGPSHTPQKNMSLTTGSFCSSDDGKEDNKDENELLINLHQSNHGKRKSETHVPEQDLEEIVNWQSDDEDGSTVNSKTKMRLGDMHSSDGDMGQDKDDHFDIPSDLEMTDSDGSESKQDIPSLQQELDAAPRNFQAALMADTMNDGSHDSLVQVQEDSMGMASPNPNSTGMASPVYGSRISKTNIMDESTTGGDPNQMGSPAFHRRVRSIEKSPYHPNQQQMAQNAHSGKNPHHHPTPNHQNEKEKEKSLSASALNVSAISALSTSAQSGTHTISRYARPASAVYGEGSIPPGMASDNDAQGSRQPPPGGDKKYTNVEFEGTIGRLVLTQDALYFYEGIRQQMAGLPMVTIPWETVAKRQMSPPSYNIPMLRVKTLDNLNYMFTMPTLEMGEEMREDLQSFPEGEDDPQYKDDPQTRPSNFFQHHQSQHSTGSGRSVGSRGSGRSVGSTDDRASKRASRLRDLHRNSRMGSVRDLNPPRMSHAQRFSSVRNLNNNNNNEQQPSRMQRFSSVRNLNSQQRSGSVRNLNAQRSGSMRNLNAAQRSGSVRNLNAQPTAPAPPSRSRSRGGSPAPAPPPPIRSTSSAAAQEPIPAAAIAAAMQANSMPRMEQSPAAAATKKVEDDSEGWEDEVEEVVDDDMDRIVSKNRSDQSEYVSGRVRTSFIADNKKADGIRISVKDNKKIAEDGDDDDKFDDEDNNFGDEDDGFDKDGGADDGSKVNMPRSLASSKNDAEHEAALLLVQEKEKDLEKREKKFGLMLLMTCCCSGLFFLLVGGGSGYFITKEVLPLETAPPINITLAPSVAMVPTAAPTVDATPQPTLRGTQAPTATAVTDNSPTLPDDDDGFVVTQAPSIGDNSNTLVPTSANDEMTSAPGVTEAPTELVTEAPTETTRLLQVLRERTSDQGASIDTAGSPQNRAYTWITLGDFLPIELSITKEVQRYALAAIYFATGSDDVWLTSGRSAGATSRQAVAGQWLSSAFDDCEWDYIVCDDSEEVIALEMLAGDAPKLRGTLPAEIGLLTKLEQLVITTGDQAVAAEARKNKQALLESKFGFSLEDAENRQDEMVNDTSTSDNSTSAGDSDLISGIMPSEIGLLVALQTLQVTNQALGGTIPLEVGNLPSLVHFDVSNNQFYDTLPRQLGSLSLLKELNLGSNMFQAKMKKGMFNQENGMKQSLEALYLNNNQLIGEVPAELGLLTGITTGLFLHNNRLTGTLPPELSALKMMKVLRVENNKFTGAISSDYESWAEIEEFQVQANGLTGVVPEELCRIFETRETVAYTECAVLECSCCQFCCSNGVCEEVL